MAHSCPTHSDLSTGPGAALGPSAGAVEPLPVAARAAAPGRRRWIAVSLLGFALGAIGPVAAGAESPPRAEPAAAPTAEPATEVIAPGLDATEIAAGAWVVTSRRPWPANVLVVRMADGSVFLADTPPTEAWTEELLDWIGERFDPPRIVAANSHYHVDAAGGNRVLRERGVEVWGSAETVELLAEKGPGLLADLRDSTAGTADEGLFDQGDLEPPDHLVADGDDATVVFGDERVEILDPGPAHSPDNVVVWFPERGILFGGCMVKGSPGAGYMGEASFPSWLTGLERLRGLGARLVVPGHGHRFDPGVLELTEQVVREAAAAAAADSGR